MSDMRINGLGVQSNNYLNREDKEDLTQKNDLNKSQANSKEGSLVSPENMAKAMELSSAYGRAQVQSAPRTVNVSKYVSKEQEARIAASMQDFEANFDKAYNAAAEEFPGLSDEAAADIALRFAESA